MIQIDVDSSFTELWRYNIFVMCGGYSEDGEQLYVAGKEVISSEDIQEGVVQLPPPPPNFDPASMSIRLECDEAPQVNILVYIVAHMLPEDREVVNSPSFPCNVRVSQDGIARLSERYLVSQWGGVSVNIKLKTDEVGEIYKP